MITKLYKKTQLIKIDTGVYLWGEYPPYTLMIGKKDSGQHLEFKNLKEIKQYIHILTKLSSMIKQLEESRL